MVLVSLGWHMSRQFYLKFLGIRQFVLVVFSLTSVTCSGLVYSSENVLTVGVVPQFEQRKLFRNWKPILIELEKLTGLEFRLVGSPKIPVFEKQFNKGVYDIAYMNPYHILKAHASQRYIPLVRDSNRLKGILVVNKHSPVKSVNDLANKTIAFPSPNALGASLLMRSLLTEKFKIQFTSRYVQTHSSVYLHVAKNLVDAGGGVDKTLGKETEMLRENLRVLYRTPTVISHPIVVHPRVPAEKRQLIKTALFKLFASREGKALFKKVPINNLVATSMEDYQSLKAFKLDKYFEE